MTILEVFEHRPFNFLSEIEIAACHIEANGRLLFLERGLNKSEGSKWGVPAGKIEKNETSHQAAVRELVEETGIEIQPNDLEEIGKLYIRKHIAYVCHLFRISFDTQPTITLSDEHTDYRWISFTEIERIPLIAGAREMVAMYSRFVADKRDPQ